MSPPLPGYRPRPLVLVGVLLASCTGLANPPGGASPEMSGLADALRKGYVTAHAGTATSFLPSATVTVTPTATPLPWWMTTYETIRSDNLPSLAVVSSYPIPWEFGTMPVLLSFLVNQESPHSVLVKASWWQYTVLDLRSGEVVGASNSVLSSDGRFIATQEGQDASPNPVVSLRHSSTGDALFSFSVQCPDYFFSDLIGYSDCWLWPETFSPDGLLFITVASGTSGPTAYPMSIWDAESGTLVDEHSQTGRMYGRITFAPDGRSFVAIGLGSFTLDVTIEHFSLYPLRRNWVVRAGKYRPAFDTFHATFAPDGETMAVALGEEIRVLRVSDGALLHSVRPTGGTTSLAFLQGGRQLLVLHGTTGRGGALGVFELDTGEELGKLPGIWATGMLLTSNATNAILIRAGAYDQLSEEGTTQLEVYGVAP